MLYHKSRIAPQPTATGRRASKAIRAMDSDHGPPGKPLHFYIPINMAVLFTMFILNNGVSRTNPGSPITQNHDTHPPEL